MSKSKEEVAYQRSIARQIRGRKKQLARYDLDPEQFAAMERRQQGLCAVCQRPAPEGPLHVDHDHDSGRVRGLLCGLCNRSIGGMADDPERLEAAARYVRHHRAVHARASDRRQLPFWD